MNTTNACPVCNKIIPENICPNCGYVRIVFPTRVPEEISRFEKERVETLKTISRRNTEEKERLAHEISQAKRNAENELTRSKSEIFELKKNLATKNSEIEGSRSEISRKNSEIEEKKSEISKKKLEIEEKNTEIAEMKRQLFALHSELETAKSTPSSPLRGIVILEDIKNDVKAAFPVYEGSNTYGSKPDSGNHHQIKFIIRGYTFSPVHFTVSTRPNGLQLEVSPGVDIRQNGRIIQNAVYARQSDNFMLGDKVRLNISPVG